MMNCIDYVTIYTQVSYFKMNLFRIKSLQNSTKIKIFVLSNHLATRLFGVSTANSIAFYNYMESYIGCFLLCKHKLKSASHFSKYG